jgi:ESCRT-II complex subunit VPS36
MGKWENVFRQQTLENKELKRDERVLCTTAQVGMYENNNKLVSYDAGVLQLTSHRLMFIPTDSSTIPIELSLDRITTVAAQSGFLTSSPKILVTAVERERERVEMEWSCSICDMVNKGVDTCTRCGVKSNVPVYGVVCHLCTYINHPDLGHCDMCGVELEIQRVEECLIKLSFRNGGQQDILLFLNQALKDKQWLLTEPTSTKIKGQGVSAILSTLEQRSDETRQTIQDSFQDLDQLMTQANQVTQLVKSILSKVQSPHNQDGEFQRQLWELGLAQPPTSNLSKTDYHKQISSELLVFLKAYSLSKKVKVISLSDVYCLFNRARRSSLISPHDLYTAASLLEPTDEFCLKTFRSGVVIMESKDVRDESFLDTIMEWIRQSQHCTPLEMARECTCSVFVAKEILVSMEEKGWICRDDTIYGLVFYPNLFLYPTTLS